MSRISQILLFFFVLYSNTIYSQSKKIKGKVSAIFEIPEGIHVSNKSKGFFTVSDIDGNFYINGSVSDTIVLTAVNITDYSIIISAKDYELGEIFPKVQENMVRLEEITLNGYQKIDLVKMGVVSKNTKEYSQAERRLNFAKSGINGFINRINGNLKFRIKELENEKRNLAIEKIKKRYNNDYFIDCPFLVITL